MNRLETLVKALPEAVDGALITSPVNRRYYAGFSSSAGTILATRKGCWLVIDSRYFEAAKHKVTGCEVILQDKVYAQLLELAEKADAKSLAVESKTMSLWTLGDWGEKLPGITLQTDNALSDAINQQRRIKSAAEIERIRAAQRITDETFSYIINHIRPGVSERQVALEMEFYGRKQGADGVAFDFIVVSGKNSSLPHGVPSDKLIESGDLLTMDFGFRVDGYCSDMTRTIAVGRIGDKQRRVYDTVLKAQLAALEAVRAGKICKEIDAVARDLIEASTFKGSFGHGLGHSLGLDVHEEPRFNPSDETVLEAGTVMSVEPGIYLEGEFGVRIEDIVAVTGSGCNNLARSPKELITV